MEVRSARQASAAPELGSLSILIGLEMATLLAVVLRLSVQQWRPIRPGLLPKGRDDTDHGFSGNFLHLQGSGHRPVEVIGGKRNREPNEDPE